MSTGENFGFGHAEFKMSIRHLSGNGERRNSTQVEFRRGWREHKGSISDLKNAKME